MPGNLLWRAGKTGKNNLENRRLDGVFTPSLVSNWLPESVTIKNVLLDVEYCEYLNGLLMRIIDRIRSCLQLK